jgi:hypothetical protein
MADVEGAFRIIDRASPVLDKIDRKAKAVDRTMEKVGHRLDAFAAKSEKDMKIAQSGMDSYARSAEKTSGKVSGSMGVMQRSISSAVSSSRRDLASLQTQMAVMDAQNVSPDIDVDIGPALAQIKLLRQELRSLDNETINIGSRVSGAAGMAAPTAGGARGSPFRQVIRKGFENVLQRGVEGAGSKFGTWVGNKIFNRNKETLPEAVDDAEDSVRRFERIGGRAGRVFGSVGERIWSWTKIILAAGPALESLAAAGSSVIGSMGGGILGAGAGLVGMIGTATVGFGGFLGALVPTITKLKESKTALDSYTKAIETYGRKSEEAEKKRRIFQRSGTKGTRQLLGVWGATKKFWRRETRPGQEESLGMLTDLARGGKKEFGAELAGISNRSAKAMRAGSGNFLETLDSPTTHRNLSILSKTFGKVTPMMGTVFANMGRVFLNLSAAAKPQTVEFFKWLDKWMAGANKDTSGLDKVQKYFDQWTTDFKTWMNFFKQAGKLAGVFFGAGQKQGNGLLNEVSHQMRGWREDLESNPKGLETWLDKQTTNFKRLTREIGNLVVQLGKMVDMLSEMLAPILDANKLVRETLGGGTVGTLGATALGAGAYYGAKRLGRGAVGSLGKALPKGSTLSEWLLNKGGLKELGSSPANPIYTREVGPSGTPGTTPPVVGGPGGEGGKPSTKGGKFGKILRKAGSVGKYLPGIGTAIWGGVEAGELLNEHVGAEGLTNQFTGTAAEASNFILTGEKGGAPKGTFGGPGTKATTIGQKPLADSATFVPHIGTVNGLPRGLGKRGREVREGKESAAKWTAAVEEGIREGDIKILRATEGAWARVRSGIKGPLQEMLTETTTAYGKMTRAAEGQLVQMGFRPQVARQIIKGIQAGDSGAKRAATADPMSAQVGNKLDPHYRRQGGGIVPGRGRQDSVPMGNALVAPGEAWIATRHHQRTLDNLLPPGVTLRNVIEGDKRWHSSPERFAAGGMTSVGSWASKMGLSVSEGPGFGGIPSGGHAPSSLHYSGNAYDISGAPALMAKFRIAAERRYLGKGLNELFYDPHPYYIDAGQKVPGAIGDHSDHVHIGFNPGGPSGANAVKGLMGMAGAGKNYKAVKAPQSKQKGVPGAMAQRAMDAVAGGLNQKLAQKAGIQGVGHKMPGRGGAGGLQQWNRSFPEIHLGQTGPKLSRGTTEQINRWAGLPPTLFYQISLGESGGYPGMVGIDPGGTEGLGLYMITTGYNDELIAKYGGRKAMLNPLTNAKAAAEIYNLSGKSIAGKWYGTSHVTDEGWGEVGKQAGGKVPDWGGWHKKGGEFRVDRPTIFGAGEAGAEDVKITPKSKGKSSGGGGGRRPLVQIDKIEFHKDGDIRKVVEREFAKVVKDLEGHIEDEDEAFA